MLASACMLQHTDKWTKVTQHMQCMKRHAHVTAPLVLQNLVASHCTHQSDALPVQYNLNKHMMTDCHMGNDQIAHHH